LAFPLKDFPKEFPFLLGKELIYLLASKGKPELEGSEWENMFANCIGAAWKPSNVGLDDKEKILKTLGFDKSWITVTKNIG